MTIRTAVIRLMGAALTACACAALGPAPASLADTNPVVPYGTSPQPTAPVALHACNDDEIDTTHGSIDLPF